VVNWEREIQYLHPAPERALHCTTTNSPRRDPRTGRHQHHQHGSSPHYMVRLHFNLGPTRTSPVRATTTTTRFTTTAQFTISPGTSDGSYSTDGYHVRATPDGPRNHRATTATATAPSPVVILGLGARRGGEVYCKVRGRVSAPCLCSHGQSLERRTN
jgi:hypothetical protein